MIVTLQVLISTFLLFRLNRTCRFKFINLVPNRDIYLLKYNTLHIQCPPGQIKNGFLRKTIDTNFLPEV